MKTRSCETCYYGKINNIGIQCAICMLKSNIREDKLELHGKNDRCEEWLARTDEYISRKEVLTIAMKYCLDDDGSCTKSDVDMRDMLDEIEGLEATDVQPVIHAYWIELPKALNPNENPCKCSNCGHIPSFMNGYPKSKYCDDCGAKMDGDTHD